MTDESNPYCRHRSLNPEIFSSLRGGDVQRRWFRVNMAKAVAPIFLALTGAFSTPPLMLTWAPMYFIFFVSPVVVVLVDNGVYRCHILRQNLFGVNYFFIH
jgi:hypothetical protein